MKTAIIRIIGFLLMAIAMFALGMISHNAIGVIIGIFLILGTICVVCPCPYDIK